MTDDANIEALTPEYLRQHKLCVEAREQYHKSYARLTALHHLFKANGLEVPATDPKVVIGKT